MEIVMTKDTSYIQVTYTKGLLILDFPFKDSDALRRKIKKIEGWDWDKQMRPDGITKKWTIPKASYSLLMQELGDQIIWKTPEELKRNAADLSSKEETLEDVLSRIPTAIDTSYMKIELFPFQKVAVGWAVTEKGLRAKVKGGLLADLMGLGKTAEALAISGHLKSQGEIKNCLVICPATLKMQWGQEVEKFTRESYVVIDGDRAKRQKLFKKVRDENIFYTIINYELLRQREKVKTINSKGKEVSVDGDYIDLNFILENNYDMVIIDEAHRMKNPDTKTAISIREIQPEYRLLMTGTPIEKDLQNIFQLADYISPNIFASEQYDFETRRKMFEDKYLVMGINPFKKWGPPEPIIRGVKNVNLLKNIIAPYMLRRTTEDVSDEMPDAFENIVVVDWNDSQRKLYNKLKDDLLIAIEKEGSAKTEEEMEKSKNEKNAMLMYMLETCDSPELLSPEMTDSPLAHRKVKETFKSGLPKDALNVPKLNRLVEMVEEIVKNGEKIVIFSKFERMTRIIRRELESLSIEIVKEQKKAGGEDSNPFKTVMYTGDVEKGCMWKSDLEKKKMDSSGLKCSECPFNARCSTRTKSAWYFQNDPDTKVIVCTDAANYGVYTKLAPEKAGYMLEILIPSCHNAA